jgi:hypothetical protein
MTRRDHQPTNRDAQLRRPVILTAILSIAATAVAVGALAVVLTRGSDQSGQADANACRTVTWYAVPSVAALPSGWAIASTRFLVDVLTTTLVGPTPSGATQGPTAFISVSCYGTDAQLAFARDHDSAVGAGSTDVGAPQLGDESAAVTSARTGSNTIFIRRGTLVADITAPTTLDQAVLQSVAGVVDGAMVQALSASPRPSATGAGPGAVASPAAPASIAPSASPSVGPSPSPAPVSHVAPDLEALLPQAIDGTAMSSQSVAGTAALGTDATSTSLIASLAKFGKTPADLEIAESHDATGTLQVRLFAFRVKGVKGTDLATAIVTSWMANTTETPTRSNVTIAGRKITKVGYTQGPADYVYGTATIAFDVETTDQTLVSKVLALLK